ncbi:hypothetical protein BDF21DRAFT_416395 [Thamnidium elegans]|nr:hypothetical protein BDF21DRAFT_416395 [Thamnidium elegans]
MSILKNRTDSFQSNTVKWPYNNNSEYFKTESFSKAGFYFVPRPKAPGSGRCFICDIELSHWKPNQSPFIRHGVESPHCPWNCLNYPDTHKRPLSDPKKALDHPRSLILPSRVKCAYYGVSITLKPNDIDLLNKHHKLSNDCPFFDKTHTTHNSIITGLNGTRPKESSTKRLINSVSSSPYTNESASKRTKGQEKFLEPLVVTKMRTKSVQKTVNIKAEDSICNINQIFTPPKLTSRVMATYDSARLVHHRTRITRNNPSGVNTLPDFKSSLIIKPTGPSIVSSASIVPPAKKETRSPRKRSLSISSVSNNDAPSTKKANVKRVLASTMANTEVTSSIKKPFEDKNKGYYNGYLDNKENISPHKLTYIR